MFSRFLGSEWANVAARALHKLMVSQPAALQALSGQQCAQF
jgi:hypothetical protein